MKVLIIGNYKASFGGIAVQMKQLYSKLNAEHVDAHLFNTKHKNFYRIFILPFKLIIRGWPCTIFHVHGCSYKGFFPIVLAVFIGKLLRKKVIVTYHGGDALNFFKSNKLGLSVLRMAHKISVPSAYLHRVFETYSIKTEIIANIVDLQESAIIDKRIFKPALITTRSLQKIYNLGTAIKVVHQLQKSYPEASLHIVGSGPEEENLKKQALQAGAKNIYFVGMVDNSRIYEILEKADFWCNPTTVDNVPVSLIEAANAGLVIITSNSGGIPYMVEHQQSAWITNSMDVEKMTAGIIYLLQHPQKANQLRKNAKERVKNYTWPSVREKLLSIYSELT